jgi:hypothetical protein
MRAALIALLFAAQAHADPLDGKSYIIELSSTQYSSGYGEYLLPPLMEVMTASKLTPKNGPGADVVVNVVTDSDVGRWVDQGGQKVWVYRVTAMVGISPEAYPIPLEGTPAFGVTALLETPRSDDWQEWSCLIRLAARTALANYHAMGMLRTDGSGCRQN